MYSGETKGFADPKRTLALHKAVNYGTLEKVQSLIENGADVNAYCPQVGTVLHIAVTRYSSKYVKYLIGKGADVNAPDPKGKTPLHAAYDHCRINIVKLLIDNGSDFNAQDSDGCTPFYCIKDEECREFTIKHLARIEAAGLYVCLQNLHWKLEFIDEADLGSEYLCCFSRARTELNKLKTDDKHLSAFLQEANFHSAINMWCHSENVREALNDQISLTSRYPQYANILITKANQVRKVIFICNNRPLVDALSEWYGRDISRMTLCAIKHFFAKHEGDFEELLKKEAGMSLSDIVKGTDVNQMHIPTLKVIVFSKIVGIWLRDQESRRIPSA